ncbi:MAG: alcohol dehydrogenase catalytic domain-containing protein [Pyrinomonadaceae bacterium]
MKALRVENKKLSLSDVPFVPANGETVVRVLMSGICNTDIEIVRGYASFSGTLGHEFVGVVESSADRPEIAGKRVVGEINAGCGKCERCAIGDPRHCPERTVLGIKGRDGAHAEFLTLPSRNLLLIPDSVPDSAAVFAEPLAAALGITEQVNIGPETKVAVIGDGKLGILCAMCMGLRSSYVTLVGRHRSKLAIAEARGVEGLLSSNVGDVPSKFDVVVEASGSETGFASALDLVVPRGKIVLKSTFSGRPTWEAWRVVVDEITIVGSRCGRMAPAVELLAQGKIDVADLISAQFPLSSGIEGFDEAKRNGTMKVLLSMV